MPKICSQIFQLQPCWWAVSCDVTGKAENNTFVCDIKVLPDPAILIAKDYQQDNLVHFSTNSTELWQLILHSPWETLTWHPSHTGTSFWKRNEVETPVGPILVHYKKAFLTYLSNASSLVGLQKDLAGMLAFGTDGEEALAQGFKHEFHFAHMFYPQT